MPTEPIDEGVPGIKLHVAGSTVYAALKNLIIHHYGITRESITADIMKAANYEAVIRDWMNGAHMREFVSRIARETVAKVVKDIVREEVMALVNGRIKISVGE